MGKASRRNRFSALAVRGCSVQISVFVWCGNGGQQIRFFVFSRKGLPKLLGIGESEQAILLTPFAMLGVMSANGRAEQIPSAHRERRVGRLYLSAWRAVDGEKRARELENLAYEFLDLHDGGASVECEEAGTLWS